MDDIDRRIVALLRENARRSFRDIGSYVHLTAPAVKRRVDRLEAEGVLLGYTAIVDPPAHTVAGEASAMIHVRARDTKDLEDTLERIRSTDGITRTVTEVVLSTLLRR
jgi:DNA-binding Lrp family transcriptional regulator